MTKTLHYNLFVSSTGKFSVSGGLDMNLAGFKFFFKEHFIAFTDFFFSFCIKCVQISTVFVSLGFFFFVFPSEECDSSNISVLINLCFTQDVLQWLRLNN